MYVYTCACVLNRSQRSSLRLAFAYDAASQFGYGLALVPLTSAMVGVFLCDVMVKCLGTSLE